MSASASVLAQAQVSESMEQVGPARVSEPEQALAMALEPAQVLGLERAQDRASASASAPG